MQDVSVQCIENIEYYLLRGFEGFELYHNSLGLLIMKQSLTSLLTNVGVYKRSLHIARIKLEVIEAIDKCYWQ